MVNAMIGKRIYNISYSGLSKDKWIECEDYLQNQHYTSGSTFINIDELRDNMPDLKVDSLEIDQAIKQGCFVDIGENDF